MCVILILKAVIAVDVDFALTSMLVVLVNACLNVCAHPVWNRFGEVVWNHAFLRDVGFYFRNRSFV